ncbi:MAG TPA: ribbon-helix-helix protein, CopG family [Thermoplasmata archaeon]|nr:ribbon-helix-helix protein, CopG family [Thermoplasmata archaeon]
MARRNRGQITVELAQKTKEFLEELVRAGEILSTQDFVRRAIDQEVDRWKREHPLGAPRARADQKG